MTFAELNAQRVKEYHKSEGHEQFLHDTGVTLRSREQMSYLKTDEAHELPLIFVVGLPRSGTTLLAQILAHYLKVGYINNFMARFWLAPVTGIELSRVMIGDRSDIDFTSDHATTSGWSNLHEFGYFWRHWLRIEELSDPSKFASSIDWIWLRRTLFNMQLTFDKSMIFKNLFGVYFAQELADHLPKAQFVYIQRNPMDVMISNLRARRAFYEDPTTWWSLAPPEYSELKDLTLYEQVAGQVHYLTLFFERQLKPLCAAGRVSRVNYDTLCTGPRELASCIAHTTGCLLEDLPSRQFTSSVYSSRLADYRQLERVCKDRGYCGA